jgi:hypothetical protein
MPVASICGTPPNQKPPRCSVNKHRTRGICCQPNRSSFGIGCSNSPERSSQRLGSGGGSHRFYTDERNFTALRIVWPNLLPRYLGPLTKRIIKHVKAFCGRFDQRETRQDLITARFTANPGADYLFFSGHSVCPTAWHYADRSRE